MYKIVQQKLVSIPQQFLDEMNRESKFDQFKLLWFEELHKMKHTIDVTHGRNALQLNQYQLTPLLQRVGLSADEAVQCDGFVSWFHCFFDPENQQSSESFVNVNSCLRLWMQQPSFKKEFINSNSTLGCHLLCAHISKKGHSNYIPDGKFFLWDEVERFIELQHDHEEMGKTDAVVNVLKEEAKIINMDPIFLARNAHKIVHIMNWLVVTKDPSKLTPFQQALFHF